MKYRIIKTFISGPPRSSGLVAALATLLACLVLSEFYWRDSLISTFLPASREKVIYDFQIWRLVTTTFIHADLQHLLSNSYMLGILIFFVNGYFGKIAYPILGLIGAALTNLVTILTYRPGIHLLGASGLVYFLAGFWLMMFVLIERQRTWRGRILRVLGVGLVILFPTSFEPSTSYRSHLIGLIFGILFALIYFSHYKRRIRKSEVKKPILDDVED